MANGPGLAATLAAVDLAAVGDASNDHETLVVIDRVHDAVVADANPIVTAPRQPDSAGGPGLAGKRDGRNRVARAT